MMIEIRGNDIEMDGKKIARLFDLTSIQRHELQEALDKANDYEDDVQKAFKDGKEDNE
jgi:phage-related protein